VDTLIHEGGAAQVEMNFLHGDALSRADQVFLFKRLVREAALRKGVYATFMAKPMADEPGSAMHLHQSLVRDTDGGNVFANEDGTDSELFHAFIAGLQTYLPDCFLLFGPYVNSYRRFTRHLAAPINLQWGYDNRTVGLRVPESRGRDRRVENRLAGADVNPYLAIAASLACGYLGMKEQLSPAAPVQGSAYELPGTFPADIFSSIDRLQASQAVQSILGAEFAEVYCALKTVEHNTFFQVISPWEREFLLLNV
jgi:glutamine synthetase